jgi:crooked neck
VDSLWLKYTYMEEVLGNTDAARVVFERWMQWEPQEQAWLSYANMELRAGDTQRARGVYERYVACHPSPRAYLKYAKWEERNGQRALARRIYERAVDETPAEERGEELYLAFAKFEERCGEDERARAIYRFALDALPQETRQEGALYREYVAHEKQHGDRSGVEGIISDARRTQYEAAVATTPLDYDAWFDYTRLEESIFRETLATAQQQQQRQRAGPGADARADAEADESAALESQPVAKAIAAVRDVYERAVANVPPVQEKRFWRRYVYLWINYALFEELDARSRERASAVYKAALALVPHKAFTFGKLWLLAAQLEVRQRNLDAARRLLGRSLGVCPTRKVLRGYTAMEERLGEVDRCRKLYEKGVTLWPEDADGWLRFAAVEVAAGEDDRARAIFELAAEQQQPPLSAPERVWKAYIDFEISLGQCDRVRALYDRLLLRTQHVKVWLSFAAFEASVAGDEEGARGVYDRGYEHYKAFLKELAAVANEEAEGDDRVRILEGPEATAAKEARAVIAETAYAFEQNLVEDDIAQGYGNGSNRAGLLRRAEGRVPKRVVKKRPVFGGSDGNAVIGYEEVYDYIFPDDEAKPQALKLLELAQKWKAKGGGSAAAALAAAQAESRQREQEAEEELVGLAPTEGTGMDAGGSLPFEEDVHAGMKRAREYDEHDQDGNGVPSTIEETAVVSDPNALDIE